MKYKTRDMKLSKILMLMKERIKKIKNVEDDTNPVTGKTFLFKPGDLVYSIAFGVVLSHLKILKRYWDSKGKEAYYCVANHDHTLLSDEISERFLTDDHKEIIYLPTTLFVTPSGELIGDPPNRCLWIARKQTEESISLASSPLGWNHLRKAERYITLSGRTGIKESKDKGGLL